MLKIAMIAGEASGDLLASSLIKALRNQYSGTIEFVGIGGKLMQDNGFISWHNMETLSVMGYIEVIKSLPALLKIRYQVVKQLLAYQPDVFIGVDAPDFNFFIERKLKAAGIKTVHYISPTIWAWRYKRIFKIKQSTDLMLCIFPFEEAIYHQVGINAKFIGHPIATAIELDIDTAKYRTLLNLPPATTIISVLSGSRIREVNSLAAILAQTCTKIAQEIPNCLFIYPYANATTLSLMQNYFAANPPQFTYKLMLNQTREIIKASDMVIAKSGTVSLETALCKKPMLICYKINKFSAWLLRRMLTVKYVGQPNIIAAKEIVAEFLQEAATADAMSNYLIELYNNNLKRKQMIDEFYKLHHQLLQDANSSGASAVLELIKQ